MYSCLTNIALSVNTLNAECKEFQLYKECTDLRDFNNSKCRKYERPVIEFWNNKMGYGDAAEQK